MKDVLFLLAALVSLSSAQWFENGKPAKETESMKTWGKFGAKLLITNKKDELFNNWEKYTPGVNITDVDTTTKGKEILGFIIFSGCQMDDAGECNSTVTYKVLKPNGENYSDAKEVELWKNKPAPEGKMLQLSVGCIGIVIDPQDPFGDYTISAIVKDKIANKEIRLSRKITVVKSKPRLYGEEPFKNVVFTKEEVDSKLSGLNKWLSGNAGNINDKNSQRIKEEVYSVIDGLGLCTIRFLGNSIT